MPGAIAPYDAREVGNYILRLANESEVKLTQMSLLKIVFYVHGWYLATYNEPLIKQPVEAWEHGPVVKVVRDAFKAFGKMPITRYAERIDLETGELIAIGSSLSPGDERFVESIFDLYKTKDAFELSDMTHREDGPWDRVWNATSTLGRLGLRIKNDDIRDYFKKMHVHGTLH